MTTNKKLSKKQLIKRGFIETIYNSNPRYFLTITFSAFTPRKILRDMLDKLLKNLNQKIYKQRFNRREIGLTGIAVAEPTPAMETDHFHIVIFDNEYLPNKDVFDHKIFKQISRLNRAFKSKFKIDYGYDFQEYYATDTRDLERYVTKQFDGFDHQNLCIDRIAPFDKDGVWFGDAYTSLT